MDALGLAMVGLATWRVSSLLVSEDGPWHVFDRIRGRIGLHEAGEMGVVQEVFSCVWCMSVWVAPVMWALHSVAPLAAGILAASAIAIATEAAVRR